MAWIKCDKCHRWFFTQAGLRKHAQAEHISKEEEEEGWEWVYEPPTLRQEWMLRGAGMTLIIGSTLFTVFYTPKKPVLNDAGAQAIATAVIYNALCDNNALTIHGWTMIMMMEGMVPRSRIPATAADADLLGKDVWCSSQKFDGFLPTLHQINTMTPKDIARKL
jgi:hypothetical protein